MSLYFSEDLLTVHHLVTTALKVVFVFVYETEVVSVNIITVRLKKRELSLFCNLQETEYCCYFNHSIPYQHSKLQPL